jgi:iron complex transport system permease protein
VKRPPASLVLALLAVAGAASIAASLQFGSAGLATAHDGWWSNDNGSDLLARVVLELRLPRALAGYAVGASLALAGVIMQVLLRNPLADPYVLGVSGGAAVGALGAMQFGLAGLLLSMSAGAGALVAMLLVFGLAHGPGGWSPLRLLLTGVVVAAGASAIVALLLGLSDDGRLRGMVFWLMGDLSNAGTPSGLLLLLGVALVASVGAGRHLNVLAHGEGTADLLGVATRPLRAGLFLAGSLLTAAAVATAGCIGFVGLITPHAVRLVVGADHRVVAPAAALAGGALLVCADLASRTLIAPRQLPVGALTAVLGVPLFLWLMRGSHRPAG